MTSLQFLCCFFFIEFLCSHQLDTDRDGRLNIRELKNHIRNFQCRNLPDYLANHILRMSDDDSDGVLDFEEFYKLSLRQEWLFSRLVFNYCKMLVPAPNRERDETGKIKLEIYAKLCRFFCLVDESMGREGRTGWAQFLSYFLVYHTKFPDNNNNNNNHCN